MPASAHAVSVAYVEIPQVCFTLTLQIDPASTGTGTPSASASTMGCIGANKYAAGEVVTIYANPAGGSLVGWSASDNDGSSADTNTWTMIASDHTVTITYTTP